MKKAQMFLIHFAGGNKYSYQPMLPYLDCFETISLELPGRGKRNGQTLLRNFNEAAVDILNQVQEKLVTPNFILFGHSMGAYLALKATSLLELVNTPPVCLIVSGNPGPGIRREKKMSSLNDEEFKYELQNLGGISEEIFDSTELMDFFLPILRADFELSENNCLESLPPISTPVLAMMGDKEENVKYVENWAKFTTSSFEYQLFEGSHFFIHQHAREICKVLNVYYDNVIS